MERGEGARRSFERLKNALIKQDEDEAMKSEELNKLKSMSDDELSKWQSRFRENSAPFIFAKQEWQKRLLERQLKGSLRNSLFCAFAGGVLGIIAGIVSAFFSSWLLK